jgi:hypothetical protein
MRVASRRLRFDSWGLWSQHSWNNLHQFEQSAQEPTKHKPNRTKRNMAYDPSQHAGAGQENLDESSSMPLLHIIQALSPQLKKKDDKFIEGASMGDIFLASTGEVLAQPLRVIPINIKTLYVEWVPKSQGGGLVGMHDLAIVESPLYEQGRKGKAEGVKTYDEWLGENELKYTAYWFLKVEVNGEWVDAMLALTSTQLKVHRKLQTDVKKFRYPKLDIVPSLFARSFELTAVEETNKRDEDYFNFQFSNPVVLDFKKDEALLNLCGDCYKESALLLPSASAPQAAIAGPSDGPVIDVAEEEPPF